MKRLFFVISICLCNILYAQDFVPNWAKPHLVLTKNFIDPNPINNYKPISQDYIVSYFSVQKCKVCKAEIVKGYQWTVYYEELKYNEKYGPGQMVQTNYCDLNKKPFPKSWVVMIYIKK